MIQEEQIKAGEVVYFAHYSSKDGACLQRYTLDPLILLDANTFCRVELQHTYIGKHTTFIAVKLKQVYSSFDEAFNALIQIMEDALSGIQEQIDELEESYRSLEEEKELIQLTVKENK